MTWHEIGDLEDFPSGRGTAVSVEGMKLAVFRLDGEVYAVVDNCPHKNLPLHPAGEPRFVSDDVREKYGGGATRGDVDAETATIRCPWHYMEWDLETGCNEPTGRCIPTYDVRIQDGTVEVDL